MLFCKDLGPIAQQIAKRKLLGCEIRTASSMSLSQNPKGKTNMEIYGEGSLSCESSNSGYSTKYIEYFNLYSYGSKEQVSVSNQDTCQVQNVKIQ